MIILNKIAIQKIFQNYNRDEIQQSLVLIHFKYIQNGRTNPKHVYFQQYKCKIEAIWRQKMQKHLKEKGKNCEKQNNKIL